MGQIASTRPNPVYSCPACLHTPLAFLGSDISSGGRGLYQCHQCGTLSSEVTLDILGGSGPHEADQSMRLGQQLESGADDVTQRHSLND
jgi:hypothetical protein